MKVPARSPARPTARRGAAAAELALVGTLLVFILVASADFARLFYAYLTITNCARDGAIYGSQDSTHASDSSGIQTAAIKDGTTLSPALTAANVSSSTGQDNDKNANVSVTVTYAFSTVIKWPGIPSTMALTRTVEMRVCPNTPSN